MGRKVTIVDLARQLGVSKTSVSYALNGQPGVGEELRQRIIAKAAEIGYRPTCSARALSRERAGAIGVLLSREPELLGDEPYYMRVIAGIESVLIERDVTLVLRVVEPDSGQELEVYERWSQERRVDGVLLFDAREADPRFALLHELGLPAVLLGSPKTAEGIVCVRQPEEPGVAAAMGLLAERGHTRIAHIAGPQRLRHEQVRERAVAEFAQHHAISVVSVAGDYTYESGRRAMQETLHGDDRVTAVLAGNDLMAIGALHEAASLGLRVPEDLSVVAWGDSILCAMASPPLTAIDNQPRESGALSARTLLDMIDGGPAADVAGPAGRLVERASVREC